MKLIKLILFIWWPVAAGLCGENRYDASLIPEDLKTASKTVIRRDDQRIVIQDNGDIVHERVYAITILGENGEDLANFFGPYDAFKRLRSVEGKIFNREGERIRKLRGEDILDISMIASYSLYEDSRIKIIDPEFNEYPYTVEYTSKYVMKSFLELPDWRIYPAFNVAIEHASFEILTQNKEAFRYTMNHSDLEPEVKRIGDRYLFRWEVSNLPSRVRESYSKEIHDISPVLHIGPTHFNYGGHPGNMSSWQTFGKWIWNLYKDKQNLEEEELHHIKALVQDLDHTEEKVAVLFKYMQDKVRYVNIKLGIGGFEPVAASQVSEVGYGDCKALSNYMKAILSAVDVPSFLALVRAGKEHPEFRADFPSQQFNHVILAVPTPADTIWLECTSQRLPAGYLGPFTDDRDVLLISQEGGTLARTPKFSFEENTRSLSARCRLDPYGNATITCEKRFRGIFFGDRQAKVLNLDRIKMKREIQNGIRLADFEIDNIHHDIKISPVPEVRERTDIRVRNFIPLDGGFLPLHPAVLAEEIDLPKRTRERKYRIYSKRGFIHRDTVRISISSEFTVEAVPESVCLETKFGSYNVQFELIGEELLYIRELIFKAWDFPPGLYRELYRFIRRIRAADRQTVLLKKEGSPLDL